MPLYFAWDTFWRPREHFKMNGNQLLRFLPSVVIILWSYATISCTLKNLMSVYYLLMLRVRCAWRDGDQDHIKNEAVRRLGYNNTCLPARWWAWRRRKPGRGGGSRVPCYSRLVGGRWKSQDCSFYGDFSVPEGANCPPAWSAKWLQEGGTSYLPVWLAGSAVSHKASWLIFRLLKCD
jgi:hypothetical protein